MLWVYKSTWSTEKDNPFSPDSSKRKTPIKSSVLCSEDKLTYETSI